MTYPENVELLENNKRLEKLGLMSGSARWPINLAKLKLNKKQEEAISLMIKNMHITAKDLGFELGRTSIQNELRNLIGIEDE